MIHLPKNPNILFSSEVCVGNIILKNPQTNKKTPFPGRVYNKKSCLAYVAVEQKHTVVNMRVTEMTPLLILE